MLIDQNNTRRFRHIEGNAVLAIYDTNRSFTLYGEVCFDQQGRALIDTATVRSYWNDELEELH